MKRDIDQEIAKVDHGPEKDTIKLSINEDTSYDINFDIYDKDDEKYFYIKMQENTANAPFYYIRSYTIKDLHQLHKIYKVFEKDNLDELKGYMKTLFDKNKISLKFEEDEVIIKMDINAQLFADDELLFFELYREMIPDKDKDAKLLDIYTLNKNGMKILKEITYFINNFKGNQDELKMIQNLKKILNLKEIPGIEEGIQPEPEKPQEKPQEKEEAKIEIIRRDSNEFDIPREEEDNPNIEERREDDIEENININNDNDNKNIDGSAIEDNDKINDLDGSDISIKRNNSISVNSQIFTDLQKVYKFKAEKGKFKIQLNVKNIFDEDWEANTIKLVCNEKDSTIKCTNIVNFEYAIGKNQDGDFTVKFSKKDMIKGKKYKCYIDLYANGKKITDNSVRLKIEIV